MLTRRRQEIARLACTQDVLEALLPPSGERRHRSRSLGKYPVAQPLDCRRRVNTLELSSSHGRAEICSRFMKAFPLVQSSRTYSGEIGDKAFLQRLASEAVAQAGSPARKALVLFMLFRQRVEDCYNAFASFIQNVGFIKRTFVLLFEIRVTGRLWKSFGEEPDAFLSAAYRWLD